MWFDRQMNEAYERGFQIGVLKAGYNPARIDRVQHVNRIDDEIIVQIREADFVVADFTGHRAGVYFEAGFVRRSYFVGQSEGDVKVDSYGLQSPR